MSNLFRNWSRGSRRKPVVSCVVCSIDEVKFRAIEQNYRDLLQDIPHEIIGIRDAKSLAEGFNRAIAKAKGEYLVLSHDDIRVLTPDFAHRVVAHLARFDVIGVAGTTQLLGGAWFLRGHPHNYQIVITPNDGTQEPVMYIQGDEPTIIEGAQALDGLFIAMRTAVARNIPFDEVNFDGFHLYDIDFTYRAYLAEYRLAVCRDLVIVHQSHGRFDVVWERYRRRFEEKFATFLPTERIRSPSAVGRFVLDPRVLSDPQMTAQLCREGEIERLIKLTSADRVGVRSPEA